MHISLYDDGRIFKNEFDDLSLLPNTYGVKSKLKLLLPLIKNHKSEQHLLDVGCGHGVFIEEMNKYAKMTVGIDYSYGMLRQAQINCDSGIFFSVADAYFLPFHNDSFDIVTAIDLFQILGSIDKAVAELYRVTKTNGKIFIATNNSFFVFRFFERIHRKFRTLAGDSYQEEYFSRTLKYNPFKLRDLLSKHGFYKVTIRGVFLFPGPFRFLTSIFEHFEGVANLFLFLAHSFVLIARK